MNNSIDISPRKKQLKEEYERLQLEYADLVAERDELENSEGPRLTALYMEAVGQLQYEVLVLQYEIALLKQKRDLLQAYKNRGEKADLNYVDEQVEATAKTYNENIQREEEKIKQAKAYIEEQKEEEKKNQEDEKRELRDLYRKLVHRLHPDLHPEQTEWEKELFLKIQEAYEKGDLERLRELAKQLEAGMPADAVDNETTEEWEERVNQLKEEIAKIREEIARILQGFPFTYRERLNDPEWIAQTRDMLRKEIAELEKEKTRLEKIVSIMEKGGKR
ncbi:MAG: DnaJ domain-containing protein [Prevotella sp.]|nr:DnaJ domain-containing protein [Prevotella sp.]